MNAPWPFMAASAPQAAKPGVVCAACQKAEAPRPLLTPLCDDCSEHLAGFGLPVNEPQRKPGRCTDFDAACDKRRFCDVEGCLRQPAT
jgi:hypothetical protein